MGYTHYLQLEEDYKDHPNYSKVFKLWQAIIEHQREDIEASKFFEQIEIKDDFVYFDGYESCYFPLQADSTWVFCKTNRESLDTAVVACYYVTAKLLGGEFTSDGDEEDLKEGTALGYSMKIAMDMQ